jgi:hypothetical protein
MSMPARLRKRHVAVGILGLAIVWWLAGIWPLTPSSRLSCAAPGTTSRIGQLVDCFGTVGDAFGDLVAAACPGGDCTIDADTKLPAGALNTLNAALEDLPLGWARPALFPAPVELGLAPGSTITLNWPATPTDSSVLTGRIALIQPNTAGALVVTQRSGNLLCSQPLGGPGAPATRLAVATDQGGTLVLTCKGPSPCRVRFDAGSSDLPGNGQCQSQ